MKITKAQERMLRFLLNDGAHVNDSAMEGKALLDGGQRGHLGIVREDARTLADHGYVSVVDDRVFLTAAGRKLIESRSDVLAAPRHEPEATVMKRNDRTEAVVVNVAESPLALLWRRKGKDGARFLAAREFAAGERLRLDFTRGQLMPRLGVNWNAACASGQQGGSGNGIAELTDVALAARLRVEQALSTVGPELSGVLVDVCCFLKGIELVEAERGWPARSAKVILKTALAALARHYEPPPSARPAGRTPLLHWGSSDYRPRIG